MRIRVEATWHRPERAKFIRENLDKWEQECLVDGGKKLLSQGDDQRVSASNSGAYRD
jgi:hypothetical protein